MVSKDKPLWEEQSPQESYRFYPYASNMTPFALKNNVYVHNTHSLFQPWRKKRRLEDVMATGKQKC
jgi:hypothetical protein